MSIELYVVLAKCIHDEDWKYSGQTFAEEHKAKWWAETQEAFMTKNWEDKKWRFKVVPFTEKINE